MAAIRIDSRDLRALIQDLKQHEDGKERRRELTKGLRQAAKPLVPKLKAEIAKIDSKRLQPSARARANRKGKTLRTTMQKAVTLQVRTTGGNNVGVRVFMNPKKMPDGMKSLPAYFEQKPGYERLRHPIFGDKERWVQQDVPTRGYFTRTVRPLLPDSIRAVNKVVDDVVRDLER